MVGASSALEVRSLLSATVLSSVRRVSRRCGVSVGCVSSTAWAMHDAVPDTAVTASRTRARSARQGAQ